MRSNKAEEKEVYKFTDNAIMKFRPQPYCKPTDRDQPSPVGVMGKFSALFSGLFVSRENRPENEEFGVRSRAKSAIYQKDDDAFSVSSKAVSMIEPRTKPQPEGAKQPDVALPHTDTSLCYLEKIAADTFLIGNENQLDLISIAGIYDYRIDTEHRWSLNVRKKISKLAIDPKYGFMAIEVEKEVQIYRFNPKKITEEPVFLNRVRVVGELKFLRFLRDSYFGLFYPTHAAIYGINEDTLRVDTVFNKKYGLKESLNLYDVSKPIQNTLNIYFVQLSPSKKTHILWRIELSLKVLSEFKKLTRIYQLPNHTLGKFSICNYSRDIILLNFRYQILSAKDGFLIDTANINIRDDSSCLVYTGEHMLHISDELMLIYSFRVNTGSKPQRVEIRSLDSVIVAKEKSHKFMGCLQMLKDNYVLFYQQVHNRRGGGEIQYSLSATQKMALSAKLDELFNFEYPRELLEVERKELAKKEKEQDVDRLRWVQDQKLRIVQEKCDVAFKIGLTRKQVYHKLWKRSTKCTLEDYKFLLDTMDYETIKEEIEKKLRKAAMSFNEVYKLEQGCFEMLRDAVFSHDRCTQDALKNYIISHFLLRKLVFYRDFTLLRKKKAAVVTEEDEEESKKIITMDIQQYLSLTKMELKSQFILYAEDIVFQNKQCLDELRLFVKTFRFGFRAIYQELLAELLCKLKGKLVVLMQLMPELLPYDWGVQLPDGQDPELYRGAWGPVRSEEWDNNLYLSEDVIVSIYNRETVAELTRTVWFKRNKNQLHDLVPLNRTGYEQVAQQIKSETIFYMFIEAVFANCDCQSGKQIISYLEFTYTQMPSHLNDKILLYQDLYKFFYSLKHYTQPFSAFLRLKDYEIFRELFRLEKVKKGCLLREAKQLFEQSEGGRQLYNEGLLSYFASDLSQISDLKYILNRLNNEKREFHTENESMYTVLIKAMQMKLKMGSDHDIPLDEVMIYVENIPLSPDSPVIDELKAVQRLGEEAERFAKVKIDMTLEEILENCEKVMTILIEDEIREKNMYERKDVNDFRDASYEIIAEAQTVKDKIYGEQHSDLVYFLYLSKLMRRQDCIPFAKILLEDEFLLDYYPVDETITENLVIYMYKWKFSQEAVFIKNEAYLRQLLELLPPENQGRRYIEAEIDFAALMHTPQYPIQSPLTSNDAVSIDEINQIVKTLNVQHIVDMDLNGLYQVVRTMQELSLDMEITSLPQIAQSFILRLIELNAIKEAIPMIRGLIKLYGEEPNHSIVFCYTILGMIMNDMGESHKRMMIKIAFYTFRKPLELLDIIEERLSSVFNNEEEEQFLDQQTTQVRLYKSFDSEEALLDPYLTDKIRENEAKYHLKVEELIFQTWTHLQSCRDDFAKNTDFSFIFITLVHDPYAVAKYILVRKNHINIRIFRSYMSYVFKQDIFNGDVVLYLARRAVTLVLESISGMMPLQFLMNQYKGIPLGENEVSAELMEIDFSDRPFLSKLQRSIQVFSKKLQDLQKKKKPEPTDRKTKRLNGLLLSELSIQEKEPSEYPFDDSDDNYDSDEKEDVFQIADSKEARPKSSSRKFDPSKQRQRLMEREGKMALFISTSQHENLTRTQPNLLIRSTKTGIKSAKLGPGGNFSSVHITRSKDRKASVEFKVPLVRSQAHQPADDLIVSQTHHQQLTYSNTSPALLKAQSGELQPCNSSEVIRSPIQTSKVKELSSPQPRTSINNNLESTQRVRSSMAPPQLDSGNSIQSPPQLRLTQKESLVNVDFDEDNFSPPPAMTMTEQMNIFVSEINENEYTFPVVLAKSLLQDYGGTDLQPIFDMSLVVCEENKEFGRFDEYLKEVINAIYSHQAKPLALCLQLIKQIAAQYPELHISEAFLEYYISIEKVNLRYKSEYRIRDMFPIDGIFLPSKDPMQLFKFAKASILAAVDYDKIVILSQIIINVLRKTEIKDELYLSYLSMQIERYGVEGGTMEEELRMLRERIEGMLQQVTMSTLLLERAPGILGALESVAKRKEVAEMIKEALTRKKKQYLIREFDRKVASLLEG